MPRIIALDPTAEVKKPPQIPPNPFPGDLNGKAVGFLNTDGAGQRDRIDLLLKHVEKLLGAQYRLGDVMYRDKYRSKTGQGATDETLSELASQNDLVINGVGL